MDIFVNSAPLLPKVNTNQYRLTAVTPELVKNWTACIDGTERTRATYTAQIKRFILWLDVKGITAPQTADIILYRDELRRTYKATTVHAYITVIKLFFAWAANNLLYPDIAANVKNIRVEFKHRKDALSEEQAAQLLHSMNRDGLQGLRNYAIVLLMITTGLRTISISLANIDDIQRKGNATVLYYQGKGRFEKADFVKLESPVLYAIYEYLAARTDTENKKSALFTSTAHRNSGERITTRSISGICKKALINAGLESDRLTAHSLRHTAATMALCNGANLHEVQQLLGHRDPKITMIYLNTIDEMQNSCTGRISSRLFGETF